MVRTRKNVWNLTPGDDTVLWYGRAVAAMQQKPISDPTSWRYQAAVHEYIRTSDPLAKPADPLPSVPDQAAYWTQCQHGSYYFLPWHRIYLHYFEQILLAEIALQGGPADWALPYWNYSANTAARLLPLGFRSPTLADGTPNPLFVAARDPRTNAGTQFADPQDTDVTTCLKEPKFTGASTGGSLSFGGPVTKFEHSGNVTGALENTPHGSMHVAVGGQTGWMSAFNTAALDPIFYLHHSNIDRLWEVWLNRDPSHADPTTPKWLTSVSFKFHDPTGAVVSMAPKDVIDATAAPLSYAYDDITDPLAAAAPPATAKTVIQAKAAIIVKPAEVLGATDAEFEMNAAAVHTVVPILKAHPAMNPALRAAKTPTTNRVFLNIENITSASPAPSYDVYLNLPPGADPKNSSDFYAGRISMFGLVETSRPGGPHAGSGLNYSLNVSDLVQRLSAAPGWNPNEIRVSFFSARDFAPVSLKVGRVSLSVE